VKWQDRIPGIEDADVRGAALGLHGVDAFGEFVGNAASVRADVRADPERRDVYLRAYRYLLEQVPTIWEWQWATGIRFCSRDRLRAYLEAFADYVFGDRPEPILPPSDGTPCGHAVDSRGECVVRAARWARDEAVIWQQFIPGIEDRNVDWAVLWVHSAECAEDFRRNAAQVRETVRSSPERRAVYLRAYAHMLDHLPSTAGWSQVTDTEFSTCDQLRDYLEAFADYVFGERAEPIPAPADSDAGARAPASAHEPTAEGGGEQDADGDRQDGTGA
jgi:hypothetical protein